MPRNVEIKARVGDLAELEGRVALLADGDAQTIGQEDIFFHQRDGRLKLRILAQDSAELIFYRRSDLRGPKLSDYHVTLSQEPQALSALLGAALGERGRVRKVRRLYLLGRTRVHLDQVEGLGDFIELEVVLREEEVPAVGEAEAQRLLTTLGVPTSDLVAEAYIDLLERAIAPR